MSELSRPREYRAMRRAVSCFFGKLAFMMVLVLGAASLAKSEQELEKPSWLNKSDEESSSGTRSLVVMAQGLGATLAVFFLGLAVYQRKFQKLGPIKERHLVIKERLPITAKTSLALIECNGKRLLCAVGPDPVTLLDQSTFMDDLLEESDAESETVLENVHVLDVAARTGSL